MKDYNFNMHFHAIIIDLSIQILKVTLILQLCLQLVFMLMKISVEFWNLLSFIKQYFKKIIIKQDTGAILMLSRILISLLSAVRSEKVLQIVMCIVIRRSCIAICLRTIMTVRGNNPYECMNTCSNIILYLYFKNQFEAVKMNDLIVSWLVSAASRRRPLTGIKSQTLTLK